MLKIKNINKNYNALSGKKDEVYLSDNKIAVRYTDKNNQPHSCLYDFNEAQKLVKNINLSKEVAVINPIVDEDEGDFISNINITPEKDIEIEIGIYIDDKEAEIELKPIPKDMECDHTHSIEVHVHNVTDILAQFGVNENGLKLDLIKNRKEEGIL